MSFKETLRRAKEIFRSETTEERTLRVERQITGAQIDAEADPDLHEFAQRYGNFAGHALMLATLSQGTISHNDRRVINSSAAELFTKSLQSGNFGNVRSGFKLLADIGGNTVLQPPPEGTSS